MDYVKINRFTFFLLAICFIKNSLAVYLVSLGQIMCYDGIRNVFQVKENENPPLTHYAQQAMLNLRVSTDEAKHTFTKDDDDAIAYYEALGPHLRSNGWILPPMVYCSHIRDEYEKRTCNRQLGSVFGLLEDDIQKIINNIYENHEQVVFHNNLGYHVFHYMTHVSNNIVMCELEGSQIMCYDGIRKVFKAKRNENPPLKYYAQQAILNLRVSPIRQKHTFGPNDSDAIAYYTALGPYIKSNGNIILPLTYCSDIEIENELLRNYEKTLCTNQLGSISGILQDDIKIIINDIYKNHVLREYKRYSSYNTKYLVDYMEHVSENIVMTLVDGNEMPLPDEYCKTKHTN